MIDPKELRVGNLVFVQSRKMVKDISEVMAIDKVVRQSCERYMPIPITLEWLERFNLFGEINTPYLPDGIEISYIENKVNDTVVSGEILLLTDIDGKNITYIDTALTHIKYVHQLQNLYHALNGNELIVKELMKNV